MIRHLPALRRFFALAFVLLLLTATWSTPLAAQAMRCDVSVNYRQLTGSGFTFLDDLDQLIAEYVNRNSWTTDRFRQEERIECSLQVVINEALTLTSFNAQLILTLRRPIYGTEQNTNILQISDGNWQFEYAQGTPLIFETERYNALTSVLDFYVYLMLGYDYDTFSELGGQPHFQKARRILEIAQSRSGVGWDALGGDRSRAELINQLLDPRFEPLRKAYFQYHFYGLDHFTTETENARSAVLEVITNLQELDDQLSRQYAIDLFFASKHKELAAIFKQSQLSAQAYGILTDVDPSNLTSYNELVQ